MVLQYQYIKKQNMKNEKVNNLDMDRFFLFLKTIHLQIHQNQDQQPLNRNDHLVHNLHSDEHLRPAQIHL